MEKSNLRNETFLYYYWKYPKYEMTKVTKRNGLVVFRKYPIYEMTKVTEINVQFTKWTCGFQKISNLRNDQSDKGKCLIYEMDLWFSENIQFTKWPINIQFTKWTKLTQWWKIESYRQHVHFVNWILNETLTIDLGHFVNWIFSKTTMWLCSIL